MQTTWPSSDSAAKPKRRLTLARGDSPDMAAPWVGGVCSGLAHYLGISVVLVRLGAVALTALGGLGFFAYMALWLWTPTEKDIPFASGPVGAVPSQVPLQAPLPQVGVKRKNETTAGQLFIIGAVFLGIALAIFISAGFLRFNWRGVIWVALIFGGLFVTWMQVTRLQTSSTGTLVALAGLGVAMVLAGTYLLLGERSILPEMTFGVVVGLVTVAAIIVALAPLGIKVFRTLATSRTAQAREAERADIAAHLHDSVLQTLTLIRGAADDPSRVRALALTQERELRSWLYTGEVAPEVSTAQALRDQAANVEATYGVPIEVVAVGDVEPGGAELAAIAAAGEAMTNAVRHGSPPIAVFQEVRPKFLEIFIKDAGPGFDPLDIPEHRQGFRNSIKGRIERVGGTASVRLLPASDGSVGGTEIHIKVPRTMAPGTNGSRTGGTATFNNFDNRR